MWFYFVFFILMSTYMVIKCQASCNRQQIEQHFIFILIWFVLERHQISSRESRDGSRSTYPLHRASIVDPPFRVPSSRKLRLLIYCSANLYLEQICQNLTVFFFCLIKYCRMTNKLCKSNNHWDVLDNTYTLFIT